jgi:transposase
VVEQYWLPHPTTLQHWIQKEYTSEKVSKLIGKIFNGFEYWFTFIVDPGVEPTDNRAERALREHAVLAKDCGYAEKWKRHFE